MDLNKQNMKKILVIIALSILMFLGVQNINIVMGFIGVILGLLTPLLIGACIAFIVGVPMKFIERHLLKTKEGDKYQKIKDKLRRPLSILLTILFVLAIIFVVMFLIVPEITRTFSTLNTSIQHFIYEIQGYSQKISEEYPWLSNYISNWEFDWEKIGNTALDFIKNGAGSMLSSTLNIAASIFSGIMSFCLGLAFGIYILARKELLIRQSKQVMYAFLPEKAVDKILSIFSLANKTFSHFLSGQCIEAVILGLMFFVGMNIFNFPYAVMISALVAFTALIPIFGTLIGAIIGTFLILVDDPIKALWFVVFFIVVQQIEGNLIYPRVVGSSIGLPSIWVLAAVTIGGRLFGVIGILVFIPLCSVFYALFREMVLERLKSRKVSPEKI